MAWMQASQQACTRTPAGQEPIPSDTRNPCRSPPRRHSSLRFLATIISTPRPGIAIGDVGSRALALRVWPAVDGMPGVAVEAVHKEHIVLRMEGPTRLEVGDKFLLVSGQQDFMTDRWDQYIAVRNGVVEAVWDILARGCYH